MNTVNNEYLRIRPSDFRLSSFRDRNGVLRGSRFVEGVETWRGIDVGGILRALRRWCQYRDSSSTFGSRLIAFFRSFEQEQRRYNAQAYNLHARQNLK